MSVHTRPVAPGLRAPLGAAAAALTATAVVAVVDPGVPGRYPLCPFLAVTGHTCPLCGGLRAVHELTRLDVPAALSYNALVPATLAIAVGFWAFWLIRARDGRSADVPVTRWIYRVILLLGVFFGVLRNLPGWEALQPG